jgi:hypothetical protein
MEMRGQLHPWPFYSQKETPVPFKYKPEWVPELVWMLWKREKF